MKGKGEDAERKDRCVCFTVHNWSGEEDSVIQKPARLPSHRGVARRAGG